MQTFYFYDLETSGVSPRTARVMQFAGQRTDHKLKPIGKPHNILIKLTEDILPEPDAIMITGITPQKTRAEGITEAEFLKIFAEEIATPETTFVGFNSVRFDDEFMRFMLYRNFADPYEWQWAEKRSRWDLLDVVRMTRALRPEGIKWPVDAEGRPTNRLELLTNLNGLEHSDAHDALSDVNATIAVARLIRNKQTKLFDYLLSMRDKRAVQKLAESGQPFVYSSGKYPGEFEKTTVVTALGVNPKKQGVLVYDLRHDPEPFLKMDTKQLVESWKWKRDRDDDPLPVKTLQFNRCPAVAPMGVLDAESQKRLQIDLAVIEQHRKALIQHKDFYQHLLKALEIMNKDQQTSFMAQESEVDAQLYDGFIPDGDKTIQRAVRAAAPDEVSEYADKFQDKRLQALLPLYKARNFPGSLTDEERVDWEAFRQKQLLQGGEKSRLARFMKRLAELDQSPGMTPEKRFLLEELQLYAESIAPLPDQ